MLWNGRGDCLLGDFGAASFLPAGIARQALQRIEVRAFACMLEEWLERCAVHESQAAALGELQRRCGQPEVSARPLFAEIRKTLEKL